MAKNLSDKKLERAIKKAIETFLKLNPAEEYKDLLIRLDGRIEWICPHGIGHTVWEPWENGRGIHTCDGCCREIKKVK